MTEEVVWTSRRALLHAEDRSWAAGRLRLSDQTVRFTALDGDATEVPLADLAGVRLVRLPRRALVLETPAGSAPAPLLRDARDRRPAHFSRIRPAFRHAVVASARRSVSPNRA